LSTPANIIASFFENRFQSDIEKVKHDSHLILAYDGVLNPETITKIEGEIEQAVVDLTIPKSPLKRIFFICVESLQNMLIHGHKDQFGFQYNYFILSKKENIVTIISANLVNKSAIPKLQNDISIINNFPDQASLKAYYMEHLEKNEISEKGGAGLGFITIGVKSGNRLNVSFSDINETHALFHLYATVNVAAKESKD
jgi:hypothetical protein